MLTALALLLLAVSTSVRSLPIGGVETPKTDEKQRCHPKRWDTVYPGRSFDLGTWPATRRGIFGMHQPVRYCWSTPEAKQHLEHKLNEAIEIWRPAMRDTSASIELDPKALPSGLCNSMPEGQRDALYIIEKPAGTGHSTSIGYIYGNSAMRNSDGRHSLKYSAPPDDEQSQQLSAAAEHAEGVIWLAHELGHALGFAHEHQRVDRAQYIKYKCENVFGYKKAEQDIEHVQHRLFHEGMTPAAEMRIVCVNPELAKQYLHGAGDYIEADSLPMFSEFICDPRGVDFDSLMIYSSIKDAEEARLDQHETFVIARKDDPTKPIWMGGVQDPALRRPSHRDVERLRDLYPLHPPPNYVVGAPQGQHQGLYPGMHQHAPPRAGDHGLVSNASD